MRKERRKKGGKEKGREKGGKVGLCDFDISDFSPILSISLVLSIFKLH